MTEKEAPGFGFQDFYLSVAAAIAGVGVAIVPRFLVAADLSDGALIVPTDCALETSHAYWLAKRRDADSSDHLDVFCQWLIACLGTPAG